MSDSTLIKEILDGYALEKVMFSLFIMEKKLDGEFIKFMAERTKKISHLSSKYNSEENADEEET